MEIEPNADLRVLDRAFLHGDIVARASDALGQQGVVVAVHVDVDLQFADRTRVRRVFQAHHASSRFSNRHYVVHGSWVGRIEDVRDDVSVRFEDGAECVVVGADSDRLIPSENSSLFPTRNSVIFSRGWWCTARRRSSEPRDGHAASTAAGETRGWCQRCDRER